MKLRKMTLNINGADRMFIFDPAKDKLSDVLRRLGLTGTKVGCGVGVCGSCNVIVNKKVVRSCTKKVATMAEFDEVITVEGIGTPMHLHPLQVAFMHDHAVQCGFCIPGFLVSAYALLVYENPNPTREEVRDWFTKNRNICRCTGYKQIVDSVMDAAKVMRGECALEDIMYKEPEGDNPSYYGDPMPRPAALAKVCGTCDYGDDIELKMPANTLHVVPFQPKITNHAKITKLDVSEAEKMPGVYKVVTAKDIEGANRLQMYQFTPRTTMGENDTVHHLLADGKILNYGDIPALVCADTIEHARDALDKIVLEIEELPSYMSYLEAVAPDAKQIHEGFDNIYSEQPVLKGDDEKVPELIEDAEYSVEGSFYSSREPHASIEGDTVQAYWDEDGIMNVHCKTMTVYFNLEEIAVATGLPAEKIRVIENPTGGSFGWAISAPTFALAAIACKVTDMPVALSMTYEEFNAISGKRSPCYFNAKLACDANGKLVAGEFDSGLDHGVYPELGDDKITKIVRFMWFPYNLPNLVGLSRVAVSNHQFGTAYRGYGAPQAYTCGEAMMDMLAEKAGIDPFEFRWINIARDGETNINSYPFKEYPMEKMMEIAKPIYEEAKKAAEEWNAANPDADIKKGVGVAWGGYNVGGGPEDQCSCAIELAPDNTFIKYDTWQDQGQGGDVGSLQCTLEALRKVGFKNVKPSDIRLIQNDSKMCPDSGESASSRSHTMNGNVSYLAAQDLKNAMTKEDGTLRTYDEMVAEGIPLRYDAQFLAEKWDELCYLDANTGVGDPNIMYTYCFYIAEVDVNTTNGKVKVTGMRCVDRVGTIGNIGSVNGQAFGGMSHSIGFALSEDYEDVKKHTNVLTLGVPACNDVPDKYEAIHLDDPEDERANPFGSSGASEAFQSSGHVAVLNAIYNACGVRIHEIPARPEKIKAGLDAIAKGEKPYAPKPYYLGPDLYDRIEDFKANPVDW
ncbi:MAG: molybdopterin-dependent oxidoreductase [Firmicutes bacterium]|nr:molybdopterin-dependent oxidoreductase [Bacillota bacterium]